MIVFLYRNKLKGQSKNIAIGIREYLTNHGVSVVSSDDDAEAIGAIPLSAVEPGKVEFTLTLGGDGTILRAIHHHPDIDAPIVGVNLGSLGFLADIPLSDIYPCLNDILSGNYTVQNRIMMEGKTINDPPSFAFNDIVFHRASNPTLVEIAIHVDGNYLNTFAADGLIFATPCGSTAYSLSAGGPILTPEIEAFVLTPISPHTISNRPIVLMPKQEIQVQYISDLKPIEVACDGITKTHLSNGDVFYISKAHRKFRLVSLPHHDYFATLRTKLGWVGKLTQR